MSFHNKEELEKEKRKQEKAIKKEKQHENQKEEEGVFKLYENWKETFDLIYSSNLSLLLLEFFQLVRN